jgi:NADH:ubiquinone reductase (H+-translocating)
MKLNRHNMKHIISLGAGFAGFWSSVSAARLVKQHNASSRIAITLINKTPYLGIRPRFYESDLSNTQLALKSYLSPLGISLCVNTAHRIDTDTQTLTLNDNAEIHYDTLIFSAGSQLMQPHIPGLKQHAFNVDTFYEATRLKNHIQALCDSSSNEQQTIVIAGGGFTGIETATEMVTRVQSITPKPRIILLDKNRVASGFSQEAQEIILTALNDLKIEVRHHSQVSLLQPNQVQLNQNEMIPNATVIWTAGMQAHPLTKQLNQPLDSLQRLPVDAYLKIANVKNCFAAGDVAQATPDGIHTVKQSCQHASFQGRFAGHNAVAELLGLPLVPYSQPKYVTCLDLGAWGALYCEGWEQKVVAIKNQAKKIKMHINQHRIYPPQPGKNNDSLLAASAPAYTPLNIRK